MRICVVTTGGHGLGGMQRHTHDLVRGLVATGHEVEVICPSGDTPRDAYGARWRHVVARGRFEDESWLRASADEFEVAQREGGFDVVHGEGSSGLGLVLRGLHNSVPLVEMFHSVYSGLARASVRRMVLKRGPVAVAREARYLVHLSSRHFRRGNWYRFRPCEIIVPSHQQVRDTIISHALRGDSVHVVRNGVDHMLWSPRPRETRPRPLIVAGGRLDPNKAFDTTILALQEIEVDLALTGVGSQLEPLRQLAQRTGVVDRVKFVGNLSLHDLVDLVARADVYVFPTLEYEASGLALLEAMSAGVPVVASRQGATSEAIDRPGENGVLIAPGKPPALTAAIRKLLANESLRTRMGAAARERVLSAYTLERMVDETVAVYEVAAGGRRPR